MTGAVDGLDDRRRAAAHVRVDAGSLRADRIPVDDDTAHHLIRVLRLRDGEVVTATDGGGDWRTGVARIDRGGVTIEATGATRHEPRPEPPLTIAAAIPKGDRLDWMAQKTTECGVDRLVLLTCDRSVVRWKPDRVERHLERLRRIVEDAARQSRRVWFPDVVGPTPAVEILPGAATAEIGGEPISVEHRTIAIGPAGGWSDDEREQMSLCVDLGPHVLRTETAAIVATTRCVALRP